MNMSLVAPPIVLSASPPLWMLHLELMLSVTSISLHLFSSLGLCIFLGTLEFGCAADIDSHLELGREFLARGQYADALSQYHAAIEGDPLNYMTYYRRATVYLALGRSKAALKDLHKVVELKPDFIAARLQRGNVLLKQGELDEAHVDFEWVLRIDPLNEEANRLYSIIEPLRSDVEMAEYLYRDENFLATIEILTRILQECPWSSKLRERRAECYEQIGDLGAAVNDLRPIVKQTPDNTAGLLKLSKLLYGYGEAEDSLNTIRECLKLDPDHTTCKAHYKAIKKVSLAIKAMQADATEQNYDECATKGANVLLLVKDSNQITYHVKTRICHCLSKGSQSSEAITKCTDVLRINPDDVNVLCDRADAYINLDQFQDAAEDFQRAASIDEHSQRAKEGLRKAQNLQKQAKKRNYYQILGVSRNAKKKEIIKAYRKLASQWHPDNFKEGEEKAKAEKKFIDIAAAKEVLTDPEKRQQFDNGEDPLDPESQAGQNFNPFAHGFHPFQNGGPFTFKFHFS